MDEVWCTFTDFSLKNLVKGASKSSLLREVATPLSSCDNQLEEITQRLDPLFHLSIKLDVFEKIILSSTFEVKVELLITSSHFFPLKELCKKNT
jgi:hypothetical protein